jgi:hypothetical protein
VNRRQLKFFIRTWPMLHNRPNTTWPIEKLLACGTRLGNLESKWKHKAVQANPRPVNPSTSHENRLAVAWVKNQSTTPHYNYCRLTRISSNTTRAQPKKPPGKHGEKLRKLESWNRWLQEQDRLPPKRTLTILGKTKLMNGTAFAAFADAESSSRRRKSKQED